MSTTCTLSWQRTGSYRARALRLGVRPFSSLPTPCVDSFPIFKRSSNATTACRKASTRRMRSGSRDLHTAILCFLCGMRHGVRHTRHMAHVAQESEIDETIIKDENDMLQV